MRKRDKVTITTGTVNDFFDRARRHARALDRNEPLSTEATITFEDVGDMVRALSAERVRLLRKVREKPGSVSRLAADLKREPRAVSRDVGLLEEFGLLRTRYETNPGHGRRKIVEWRAAGLQLKANL